MSTWTLYLLECTNGAFYAGITNNMQARYQAHLSGKGAKYTRANPPVAILATAEFPDRSSASKAEWTLKQCPRKAKLSEIVRLGQEAAAGANECEPVAHVDADEPQPALDTPGC